MRPVFYDLQGAQSLDHRDRGIARYVVELAVALEAADPGRVGAYLLNPDLALPGGLEPLVASGKLRFVGEVDVPDGAVLHLPSTIELAIPLDRLFAAPARTASLSLVVTLFDLVQEALPEVYLEDPGIRRRYRSRLELVRQADAVVSISAHTGREATRLLGVAPERVHPIPLVPSPVFRPASSREAAVAAARAAVPGLRPEYVLYTAGSDGRKNVERLIEAWAQLPASLRERWQLVIACHLPPLRRNHFDVMADGLGLGDGFLTTGFVDEATLVHLNQGAALAVMPSLDEGFGFPVVEALACGTPAIGSDRTSIPELLPPEALFDPTDAVAIAAAITAALTDRRHRARLQEWAARPVRTWADVATATTAVYDSVTAAPTTRPTGPARRRRPAPFRLAFTTPLPPQPGGVADYSARLLGALARVDDVVVDAYVDGPPHERTAILAPDAPAGVTARPLAALDRVEAMQGRYDAVVHSLGNSEFHTGALAALHRRGGTVLAHDVRLTNLHRFAQWQHPQSVPGGFHATLQRMYDGAIPPRLGEGGGVTAEEAERWGLFMARDAVRASDRFLVTSAFAAELARLDARPEDRPKIGVLPFAIGGIGGDAEPSGAPSGPPVVASFGVVNALKQGPLVVEAFATATLAADRRDARLVFVGPAGAGETALILARAAALGLEERVEVTGAVDEETYRGWLARTAVAIQLRAVTNGESSAAIGDCLAAGIPTIVSAIGANRALPDDAAVALPATADADAVSDALARLLRDAGARGRVSEAARRYARAHSFAATAEALYRLVASAASS